MTNRYTAADARREARERGAGWILPGMSRAPLPVRYVQEPPFVFPSSLSRGAMWRQAALSVGVPGGQSQIDTTNVCHRIGAFWFNPSIAHHVRRRLNDSLRARPTRQQPGRQRRVA